MERNLKILITGGNGYVAKALLKGLRKYNTTAVSRKDFDLCDSISTNNWFKDKEFDIVIHTAVRGGSRLKKDNGDIFYENVKMFYNLYNNKNRYNKFIHFGSGAELNNPTDPYGFSKRVINDIILKEDNFYNIRIFGVFDYNELDTRFIKSNIRRYCLKENFSIHQDKQMDFFYMKDLITLIKFYIDNDNLAKEIECRYNKTLLLSEITQIINNCGEYNNKIKIKDKEIGTPYKGVGIHPQIYNLSLVGLENGIKETFNKIYEEFKLLH